MTPQIPSPISSTMVERKTPKKLGSQTKSKQEPVRYERNLSSYQQQDSRSKGGLDTKKKVNKVICTKISDLASEQVQFSLPTMHKRSSAVRVSDQLPNYMKSSCRSDVRKEKFKVTNHSPTTGDRIRSPRYLSLNYSKPSTSFPDGSGLKHVKILKRKPTLKQIRPWMKKNSLGVALCPKQYVNRATCSSTLKDSKFPKALELNPGGTEAEGTSVVKVCPYTYCSLNGHRHESLPPLKCFLSLRRTLLKTQKSMKATGVSPFRKKGLGKDKKEVETGQALLSRATSALEVLMEEVANDFFGDIHAEPHKQIVKSVNCHERSLQEKDDTKNPEVPRALELTEDDGEGDKCKEDDGRNLMDEIYEYNSAISFEEYLDQNSDLSIEEMDVMMSVQEYVNCDQQNEDEERNSASSVGKDGAELSLERLVMDGLVKESEGFVGSAIKGPFEAGEVNLEDVDTFPGNKTDRFESTDDGFCPLSGHFFKNDDPGHGPSLNAKITSVACKIAESAVEPSYEAYKEVAEHAHTTASEGSSSERNCAYSDKEKESSAVNSVSCDDNAQQDQRTDFLISKPPDEKTLKENDMDDPPLSKENSSSASSLGHLEASKGTEGSAMKHDLCRQNGEGEASEADDLEVNHILDIGNAEETIFHVGIKEDDGNEEVEDAISSSSISLSGSNKGSTKKENGATEPDHIKTETEIKVHKHADTTEEASTLLKIHLSFSDLSDEVDKEDNHAKSQKKHQEEADKTEGISQPTEQDWCKIDHAVQIKDDLEICLTGSTEGPEEDRIITSAAAFSNKATAEASGKQKAKLSILRKSRTDDEDKMKEFNPRAPNFLPVEPDPEAEKVDLRHQEMDERKNAEEWMIDYALQQAVTKLAPARKRKVALLVEAFETVMPMPLCEKGEQHTSQGFDHARPIQACS